jgi:LmbE family N-acetylglucosaminyl deacetylase
LKIPGGSYVLVLSAHPDDMELSAGGTIAKLVSSKQFSVKHVIFSTCVQSLEELSLDGDTLKNEAIKANSVLGIAEDSLKILDFPVRNFGNRRPEILQEIWNLNKRIKPDIVFIPHENDLHQDHSVLAQESLRVFKNNVNVVKYAHQWNRINFHPNFISNLTKTEVRLKLEALSEYKSQQNRTYFDSDYLKAELRSNGIYGSSEHAELFELHRCYLN